MQFLYETQAGKSEIFIVGENYRYLFKVRRFAEGQILYVRNLQDEFLYRYKINSIGKKDAKMELIDFSKNKKESKFFHLIWCMIDTKIVEKTLPMLNQLGVSKISFVYCERSQKNFKLDMKRVEKILINSSQQCGRDNLMQLEIFKDLQQLLESYSDIYVLDFGGKKEWSDLSRVLVGCEGGFSENERKQLQKYNKIGLNNDLILKSETATVAIASKLLI